MKNIFLFFIFILFCFSCYHNEVKKEIIRDSIEQITTDNIESLYNRLITGIIHKKLEKIGNCYTNNAIFQYSDNIDIKCFDGSKKIMGVEAIKKNYEYLLKIRYFNIIEYEIVKMYKDIKNPRVIFINLWLNVEFDFYEVIECVLINGKYYINNHKVLKGSEIRSELYN